MNGRRDRKSDIYGTEFYANAKTDYCRKVCYSTRSAAKPMLKRLGFRRFDRGTPGTLNIYFCQYCQAFHVGHTNKPRIDPEVGDDQNRDGTPEGA